MAKTAKTKQFKTEFNNEFTFQKVPAAHWLDIMDDAEVDGKVVRKKLYPAVLESVVVQPGQLKIEDFDNDDTELNGYAELEEVVKAAIRFQQGKQ